MKKKDESIKFVNLKKLLKQDNSEVKKIKSLYQKEQKYLNYLGPIEYASARYYYDIDKNFTDKRLKKIIINLKENYDKDVLFFKTEIEEGIMYQLSGALQEKPITLYELNLVFDHILWVIDNRSWSHDKQAYLKWLASFFKLYTKKEQIEYGRNFEKIAKRMGIGNEQINAMLMKENNASLSKEDQKITKLESEFYAMTNEEKIMFLMENGTKHFNIFEEYLFSLEEDGNGKQVEKLYSDFLHEYPDFIPAYISFSEYYNYKKNPILAKHYLEAALKELDRQSNVPKLLKENLKKDILKYMKMIK